MKIPPTMVCRFFVCVFLLQCSGKSKPLEPISAEIRIEAASGGTIALENGISLEIPPGALRQDTDIRVEALQGTAFDEFGIVGARMEPDGLEFDTAARIRLPLPPDWDNNERPYIYEAAGQDPASFFLTDMLAQIVGEPGAYFAEIEVGHFSSLGAARNCHAGTINYLFEDFSQAACSAQEMTAQIQENWGNRFVLEDYQKVPGEFFVTNVPIQCFLDTYAKDFRGFSAEEPVGEDFLVTLKEFLTDHKLQVVVGFSAAWPDADNDGIYEGFAHSAVLEMVDGQLKLRQSVSVNDKVIKLVIDKFGENAIYYPRQGELTADLLNQFRATRSGVIFEQEICGSEACIWPNFPVERRPFPYKAVRFYVSKYSRGQNPCEQTEALDFTTCWVKVKVGSIFYSRTETGGETFLVSTSGVSFGELTFEGNFIGNTFTGFYDEVISAGDWTHKITGSVTAQLTNNRDAVSNVVFSRSTDSVNSRNSNSSLVTENFTGSNIPVEREGSSTYRVEDGDACDHMSSLSYYRKNVAPDSEILNYEEVIDRFECDVGSQVTVFFSR